MNKKINSKINNSKKTVKKAKMSNEFRTNMTLKCQAKGIIVNQNARYKMLPKLRACYSQKLWGINRQLKIFRKRKSVKIFLVRENKENIECFGKET